MHTCYKLAGPMVNEQWSCCYGGLECTAAPLSTSPQPGSSQKDTATGGDQKQTSGSEPKCQTVKASSFSNASMQDLYLLLRGLSDGGFELSVTVQATPSKPSLLSLSDTLGPYGCSTMECPCTEWRQCLGVATAHWRSTTRSSKQTTCSDDDDEHPTNRRY